MAREAGSSWRTISALGPILAMLGLAGWACSSSSSPPTVDADAATADARDATDDRDTTADAGGAAVEAGTDGPGSCLAAGDPLAFCAATSADQRARLAAGCPNASAAAVGTCGGYVIFRQQTGFDPGAGCFYDSATQALVAYEYCADVPSFCDASAFCHYAGAPIEGGCDLLTDTTSSFQSVCTAN